VKTLSAGATPLEHSFGVTQTGSYQVTLTDLQLPAALSSAKLAVTSGTTVLTTASTTAGTPTGTANFRCDVAGDAGDRIVGQLATGQSSGNVGVRITRAADSAVIQDFVGALGSPAAVAKENRGTLDENFTAQAAGN